MDWTPAADNALIARLPVGIVSLDNEPGFDLEIETGFVGEVDTNAMVAKLGRELDAFDNFAFGMGKGKDFPQPMARDAAFWFGLGGLLVVDGTFSFTNSHFRLSYRWIWLGLRSMLTHRALPAG